MRARLWGWVIGMSLIWGTQGMVKVGVFWVSEPVQPGDVVMLYGGGLREVSAVRLSRLPDAPVKAPFVRPSPSSSGEGVESDHSARRRCLPEICLARRVKAGRLQGRRRR